MQKQRRAPNGKAEEVERKLRKKVNVIFKGRD